MPKGGNTSEASFIPPSLTIHSDAPGAIGMNTSKEGMVQIVEACNSNIRDSLEMARRLTVLADRGEADGQDDGCRVLYGVVRDCAYKIRIQAEREKEAHLAKGLWT